MVNALSISVASTGATAISAADSPACCKRTAGARSHRPRQGLRCQVARPSMRGRPFGPDLPLQRLAQLQAATNAAGDVVTDVRHDWRLRFQREERVEAGHTPGFGGWYAQPLTDVVQPAWADVADARLHRLQRG